MAHSVGSGDGRALGFAAGEFTGALGDSVTVLPVVVAAAALSELSLGAVLLGFAAFQLVWGLHYRLPVSVEPMKALAALVVAGVLSAGELAAAGVLAGTVLLAVGATGTLGRVERYLGEPVVRGVQLAVALVLLRTGVELGAGDPALALAAAAAVAGAWLLGHRRAGALVALALGGGLALAAAGAPTPAVPALDPAVPPVGRALARDVLAGTAGQLAMTVGNAAVATSLLLSEFYDADVSPDALARSMGVMNLLAAPLGAMPMCHGSGGVAGKHAFGARTAGANVVLAALYGAAAFLAVGVVAAFPMAVLGVVLVAIGLELGRAGIDTPRPALAAAVGVAGLVWNVGAAFVLGAVAHRMLERRARRGATV